MVSAFRQKRYGGIFPDCLEKLHGYIAAKSIYVPSNFRKIEALVLWGNYLQEDQTLEDFVSSSKSYFLETSNDFSRRVNELCSLFGIVLSDEELELENLKYQYLAFLGNVIPQLKFSTNAVFNRFWRQDPPEGDKESFMGAKIFPRRLKIQLKYISSVRNSQKFTNQVLLNTVFQGFKKGLLPLEPHMIQKSLDKHRVALTKDSTISPEMEDKIERYSQQIFKKFSFGKYQYDLRYEHVTFSNPDTRNQSTHSTSVYNYSQGGNVGYSRDFLYPAHSVSGSIGEPDLCGFVALKGKAVHFPVPVYQRRPIFLRDILATFHDSIFGFRKEYPRADEPLSAGSYLEAIPAVIVEPMKARLITKPGLGLHVRMHKLQKSLRHYFRDSLDDLFCLTGEPLRRDHLWNILGRGFGACEGIVSADFSAATDNLKGAVTQAILKYGLGDKIFHEDAVLYTNLCTTLQGLKILQTRSVLPKYDNLLDGYSYNLQDFVQTNGQLMGHVISFLILCVANLCSYWDSWERYLGVELTLEELRQRHPCLINGDDLLFKSCHDHYKIWWSTVKEYGLEPSVGKNFYSDRFLQLNSELWRIDTRLAFDSSINYCSLINGLKKIPYVNFGLITNRKKQDCSVDVTIVQATKSFDLDTLESRLASTASIREKLFSDLPDNLFPVVNDLFNQHSYPINEHFGIHSDLLNYGVEGFDQMFRSCFTTGLDSISIDQREAVGDLSTKLERGSLALNRGKFRVIQKWISQNPFALFGDSLFPVTEEEQEWVSV